MILFFMLFLHIVDDFYLQKGLLANLKQKRWWKENCPSPLYENDWIISLAIHSFSWAFMIMLPIAFVSSFELTPFYALSFIFNAIIHGVVDHLKANKLRINLWTDQIIHCMQIAITYVTFMFA